MIAQVVLQPRQLFFSCLLYINIFLSSYFINFFFQFYFMVGSWNGEFYTCSYLKNSSVCVFIECFAFKRYSTQINSLKETLVLNWFNWIFQCLLRTPELVYCCVPPYIHWMDSIDKRIFQQEQYKVSTKINYIISN